MAWQWILERGLSNLGSTWSAGVFLFPFSFLCHLFHPVSSNSSSYLSTIVQRTNILLTRQTFSESQADNRRDHPVQPVLPAKMSIPASADNAACSPTYHFELFMTVIVFCQHVSRTSLLALRYVVRRSNKLELSRHIYRSLVGQSAPKSSQLRHGGSTQPSNFTDGFSRFTRMNILRLLLMTLE